MAEISAHELLRLLLDSSEAAAQLARVCRHDGHFDRTAVQAKPDVVKNQCAVEDFKTVADVTVQAMLRHHIAGKFAALAGRILGEESSQFAAPDGSSVQLTVQTTQQATAQLLSKALGGAAVAAEMAAVVHAPLAEVTPLVEGHAVQLRSVKLPVDHLAVWIDPIDCTSEYISGRSSTPADTGSGIVPRGLAAVTVLVGVFLRATREPLMGVVTQPFARRTQNEVWKSAQYWGVCWRSLHLSNISADDASVTSHGHVVVTSSSERDDVIAALRSLGLRPLAVSGAGYKLLQVALGSAAAYVVSLSSTFLWDTCGPDALIRGCGGSLLFLNGASIKYGDGTSAGKDNRNRGCLVATLDPQLMQRIQQALNSLPDLQR